MYSLPAIRFASTSFARSSGISLTTVSIMVEVTGLSFRKTANSMTIRATRIPAPISL